MRKYTKVGFLFNSCRKNPQKNPRKTREIKIHPQSGRILLLHRPQTLGQLLHQKLSANLRKVLYRGQIFRRKIFLNHQDHQSRLKVHGRRNLKNKEMFRLKNYQHLMLLLNPLPRRKNHMKTHFRGHPLRFLRHLLLHDLLLLRHPRLLHQSTHPNQLHSLLLHNRGLILKLPKNKKFLNASSKNIRLTKKAPI